MTALLRTTFRFTLFAFIFALGGQSVVAQNSEAAFDCSIAEKLTRPKGQKVISFGVLNGKAINLVKPKFPAAAHAIGVRGSVVVQIFVDPHGCVSEAKVVSGHPLLVSASVQAALKSSFAPVQLSGVSIWINGVITYNYISDKANWLEIGFFSDSQDKLIKHLPPEFDRVRIELKDGNELPYDESQKAIRSAVETISVELIPFPKEQWLFDLGRKLQLISRRNYNGVDGLTDATQELRTLVETAPTGVSPQLIVRLNQLIEASPREDFWEKLKEIETLMFQLGN